MRNVAVVAAVVWVLALLGLSTWVWVRWRNAGLDRTRAEDRRRAERDRRRPERDLERAVREATTSGAVVVVERRGADPVRVRWSDGSVWFYYRDQARMDDARRRGALPAAHAVVGAAPDLGAARRDG